MDWVKLAKEVGFEAACELNMETLTVLPEVREMCSADKCGAYGKRWSCPPGCGDLSFCRKRIASYASGLLLQTTGPLEDAFDLRGIAAAQEEHSRRFAALARQIRHFQRDCLPLAAGACTRCEVCSYPSKPCRFPGKMFSSMEAYGLLVSDICQKNHIPYYHGENTISFTSCILLDKKETPDDC